MSRQKSTLVDNERRFKRACEQIVQLNYSLDVLQQRYNKAKKDNHKSFRYSLRFPVVVQRQPLLFCGRIRKTCCVFHQEQQCVNVENIWMTCGYLSLLCCIFVEEHHTILNRIYSVNTLTIKVSQFHLSHRELYNQPGPSQSSELVSILLLLTLLP
jgi:hypothetical protein